MYIIHKNEFHESHWQKSDKLSQSNSAESQQLIWAFLTLNLSLSRNHKAWDFSESRSTDFSLWEIEFSDVEYDDEKKHCDKEELM